MPVRRSPAASRYLTNGDIRKAMVTLHERLTELLRFGDAAINDAVMVDLVVRSIDDDLSKAAVKDLDAMGSERRLSRARATGFEELWERIDTVTERLPEIWDRASASRRIGR